MSIILDIPRQFCELHPYNAFKSMGEMCNIHTKSVKGPFIHS